MRSPCCYTDGRRTGRIQDVYDRKDKEQEATERTEKRKLLSSLSLCCLLFRHSNFGFRIVLAFQELPQLQEHLRRQDIVVIAAFEDKEAFRFVGRLIKLLC